MRHLKQEFDKLSFKEALIYGLAVVSMTVSFVLLFLSLYIPPEGEIHASVLAAFGAICAFAATLLGVSMHYASETAKFKEEISKYLNENQATPKCNTSPSPN